jgi:integrase
VIVAGKRRTIRLGAVPKKTAETVKLRVEMLAAAVATRTPIDAETAQWVGSVDDALAAKLAAADLVPKRDGVRTVGVKEFCTNYVAGRPDVAPNTRRNLLQATRYLAEFFGAERRVTAVTAGDASRFAAHMRANYAPATANRTIVHAKQFFKAAERDELIERSPFRDEKGGSMTNPDRMHFVTPEQTAALLDACPVGEWRLIVALARYGGLRTPSEHLALTWGDVDWERERFLVRSPKTGLRWVPLFPELRPHLDEAFDRAEEGATHVITRTRDAGANWRTTFNKIVLRAGLLPWEKPFQNLRASRETELAQTYPLHIVTAWIGNSVPVAAKHYLQVTDADFERAVKGGARDGAECGADRSGRERTGRDETHASTTKPSVLSATVPSGLVVSSCPVPREGVEPSGRVS